MTPQSQGRQRHGYVFIPWISTVMESTQSTVLEVVSETVINNKKKQNSASGQKRHRVSVHVHDADPAPTIQHTLCRQL